MRIRAPKPTRPGRILIVGYINSDGVTIEGHSEVIMGGPCTAGFGAREKGFKANGEAVTRVFLLTAGHCAPQIGKEVWRAEYDGDAYPAPFSDAGKDEGGRVARTGMTLDEYWGARTDGSAIRVSQAGVAPGGKWVWNDETRPTRAPGRAKVGNTVCYSGAISKQVACGEIVARSYGYRDPELWFALGGYWVKFREDRRPQHGDSGGPVWNLRTGKSIGLVSAGRGGSDHLSETLVVPLVHPPNMPSHLVPGILHNQNLRPLELRRGE